MIRGKPRKIIENLSLSVVVHTALILLLLLCSGCEAKPVQNSEPVKKPETTITPQPAVSEKPKPKDENDPRSLSFTSSSLLFDSDLRNILSESVLEYCSYVIEDDDTGDLTLTWNLKSSGKEVYRCEYSFDKKRNYSERSKTACRISEAYDDYLAGDTALIRDYVMPEKGDAIDMFVYENSSSYYEEYFILGKYSDMYCYTKGDDIYFEYYWYQNTVDGRRWFINQQQKTPTRLQVKDIELISGSCLKNRITTLISFLMMNTQGKRTTTKSTVNGRTKTARKKTKKTKRKESRSIVNAETKKSSTANTKKTSIPGKMLWTSGKNTVNK